MINRKESPCASVDTLTTAFGVVVRGVLAPNVVVPGVVVPGVVVPVVVVTGVVVPGFVVAGALVLDARLVGAGVLVLLVRGVDVLVTVTIILVVSRSMQITAASTEYCPSGQSTHNALPIMFLYFPAAHPVHVPPFSPLKPTLQ
jgi:hypothetical protein